jgi:DNA-binding transcriptional regulator LsrR (DeoR family)
MNDQRKKITYKIAKAYYENGLKQQEIADRYGISRIMVSRLLQKALEEKIVQIHIRPPEFPFAELEQKIEDKYHLQEVIIIDTGNAQQDKMLKILGAGAANYLIASLEGHETIAVTWGKTLSAMVSQLPAHPLPNVKVTQMLGGLGGQEAEFHGTHLTRRLAEAFQAKPWLLHAPGIVKNKAISDGLKAESQVQSTLDLASKADIALLGLGLFDESSILIQNKDILSAQEAKELKETGAIGDVSLRFFNREGKRVVTEVNERVVGLELEEIKEIPRRVGLAAGEEKYETVMAAINGEIINVLITNQEIATKLTT